LYPSDADRFFLLDEDVDLVFAKDARGNTTEMQAMTNGQTVRARKLK
jgi:hypothetical protein